MGSEEAQQLGLGGSSSEGLEQPSVGPPLHQGNSGTIPHLLLEHRALDCWFHWQRGGWPGLFQAGSGGG